jgi:Flp pilus assembly protein TadG
MVEFALVLPFLLLVVFGIFDFGRAINYWIDSTHLSNEAARLAAVGYHPSSGNIASYVRAHADSGELTNGSGSVTTPIQICVTSEAAGSITAGNVGSSVKATTTFTYRWFPFLGIDAASTNMGATATMRLERPLAGTSWVTGCS